MGLITDGRFSGFNRGPIVGHVSPEAIAGGVIAIIQDGDMIEMDIPKRVLNVELTEQEIARRLKDWRPPEPRTKTGFLALYAQLALPADQARIAAGEPDASSRIETVNAKSLTRPTLAMAISRPIETVHQSMMPTPSNDTTHALRSDASMGVR